MDLEERVERLERRFRELEDVVEDLQAAAAEGKAPAPPQPLAAVASLPAVPPRTPSSEVAAWALSLPKRPPAEVPIQTATSAPPPGVEVGSEQWIGQWGLLAVGVALVVLAAGYFVKLAIDRGWISPLLRCSGGALLGAVLAWTGWRLYQRGLRSYGAALIGCGAAVMYVAVWAAVRLYDLLPPTVGLGIVALLSLGVFAAARAIDIEALGAAAALGAFAAPAMLGTRGHADLLLLYAASLAAGLGWVAERRWRLTTSLIGLSFFTIGWATPAAGISVLMYAVLGASAGLYVGLREEWPEVRFLAFGGGWLLVGVAAGRLGADGQRLITAGAVILAAPVWWRGLREAAVWPEHDPPDFESFYFYATPWLLAWGLTRLAPGWLGTHAWVVPLVLAALYLVAGYTRPRVPFAIVGAAALIVALLRMADGDAAVWGLLALALAWAGVDHALARTDGRWYALTALGIALLHLLFQDLPRRGLGAAFRDPWALAFWATVLVCAVLAAGLWRRIASAPDDADMARRTGAAAVASDVDVLVQGMLWAVAGLMVFLGVTGELMRYFGQVGLAPATAQLAGGLSVSAWWALFAAGLVIAGFWRGLKPVRMAGLLVSGLAVAKVLLRDLSQLSALYRVASVLILGLAALAVAYLYHRYTARQAGTA